MKKIIFIIIFCWSAVAFAQIPRDLITSDPETNKAIAIAIQQYGEQAVREALRQGNSNQSSSMYRNNGYQNSGYQNNGYQNSYGGNSDRIIQGVYFYNGQTSLVNLRYTNGKVMAYSTSQDQFGHQNWRDMYPDNPHPTDTYEDGRVAYNYRYKVSIGNTWVYFNM